MVSFIATTGWHVAAFSGIYANYRLPNKGPIAILDTLYCRKNFIGLDWMSSKKLENLWLFERILWASNQLQLVLGGPKRTHVHCSYKQTRDFGHWDHTSWLDWFGTSRYDHWNGPLYDVKISRHLNVHWGHQIVLFGHIQPIRGQHHAIGRLVVVWGMKMQKRKSKKLFFKSETLCFDEKLSQLLVLLVDLWLLFLAST